jgi:hypothetical protein
MRQLIGRGGVRYGPFDLLLAAEVGQHDQIAPIATWQFQGGLTLPMSQDLSFTHILQREVGS